MPNDLWTLSSPREIENFFYIVQMLEYVRREYGDNGYDPGLAIDKCLEIAKNFEADWNVANWDDVPDGYWGTIDIYAHENLSNWFDEFQDTGFLAP